MDPLRHSPGKEHFSLQFTCFSVLNCQITLALVIALQNIHDIPRVFLLASLREKALSALAIRTILNDLCDGVVVHILLDESVVHLLPIRSLHQLGPLRFLPLKIPVDVIPLDNLLKTFFLADQCVVPWIDLELPELGRGFFG